MMLFNRPWWNQNTETGAMNILWTKEEIESRKNDVSIVNNSYTNYNLQIKKIYTFYQNILTASERVAKSCSWVFQNRA